MLGKPLMEWQQHVADVVLEIDPDTGRLAYDEYVLTVPRQSGKSTFILAKSVHRCSAAKFFGASQRMVYTAQNRLKAREKFEVDYLPVMRAARKFRAVNIHLGNGNEHFRFPNGSRWGIEANTDKAGHGGTLDEAFIDEAFSQVDSRMEQAFGPAMITRQNKQLGIVSTAGWTDASPYLLDKVRIGRQQAENDVRTGTAYFEWSASEDADPTDEAVWLGCMPAVHRPDCAKRCSQHTIALAAIRGEFEKAKRSGKLADFRRAYLNQWVPRPREGEETALGNWRACQRDILESQMPAPLAIGVSISWDRSRSSITTAGLLEDDLPIVAPSWQGPVEQLATEASRISREIGCPVAVDVGGTVDEDFATEVEALGGWVERFKLNEYVTACNDIYDRVQRGAMAHTGDPLLNEEVEGARWRPVGDGRRVFGRRQSETDIPTLEAATLALAVATKRASVYEDRGLVIL